jgi:hypothetical protein
MDKMTLYRFKYKVKRVRIQLFKTVVNGIITLMRSKINQKTVKQILKYCLNLSDENRYILNIRRILY